MRLILISEPGARETDRLIEAACAARGLPFVKLIPGAAAGVDLGPPGERRLIYRTGVNFACLTLEKLIYRPGDAILHDPYFTYANQALIFRQAGLPRPKTVFVPDPDPAALAGQVAGLGGFPVVVKVPGGEGGKGVSLAHDLETLAERIETAAALPLLEAFTPHARSWRATVLNGRMLCAYARSPGAGDFRSNGPGSGLARDSAPPPGLADIAVRAAHVLRLEFGGADILEGEDGRLSIAEFNFPCYFAEAQQVTGVDVAGAIVDRLIEMPPHPTAGVW